MAKGSTPSPKQPVEPKHAVDAGTKEIDAAGSMAQPDFPIVGIGCSAGGLEALDALLGGAPADSGMAFVIVQHLDPHHVSNLPDLLQRATPMPVFEAGERMLVRPGCVYVIPPNKDLSLHHLEVLLLFI